MNEDNLIAAILATADNSDPEKTMQAYDTFRSLIQAQKRKESEASIPEEVRPLIENAKKKRA